MNEALVERAIEAGLTYIISLQSEEGLWREWELPPGNSTAWATAYVGYKLRCLPASIKQKIEYRLSLAGNWLLDNASEDGGWGYNSRVGPDADSTAFAILFLTSVGHQVPEAAFAHLSQYQSSDGGFSTYQSTGLTDSWTVSHPDVTPMALLAMSSQPAPSKNSLQIGIDYVLKQRTADFGWNTFWWNSSIYSTEANLSFLNAVSISSPCPTSIRQFWSNKAFETALYISSLLYLNPTYFCPLIKRQVDMLITLQRPDGSWNESPVLRITRRDCFTPWTSDDPGPLFSDTNRLFTTAAIIEVLSRSLLI